MQNSQICGNPNFCEVQATLREEGPEVLGTLRGREGWLAGRAAQDERTRARSAAAAIGCSLDREAMARDAAVRHHTGEVEQQRARDAVEVPGLSQAALDTLKAVQMARLTAEIPREGRADPRVANELDGFLTAASQRLGEEGALNASRAASSSRRMELPGVGRERRGLTLEPEPDREQQREGRGLGSGR